MPKIRQNEVLYLKILTIFAILKVSISQAVNCPTGTNYGQDSSTITLVPKSASPTIIFASNNNFDYYCVYAVSFTCPSNTLFVAVEATYTTFAFRYTDPNADDDDLQSISVNFPVLSDPTGGSDINLQFFEQFPAGGSVGSVSPSIGHAYRFEAASVLNVLLVNNVTCTNPAPNDPGCTVPPYDPSYVFQYTMNLTAICFPLPTTALTTTTPTPPLNVGGDVIGALALVAIVAVIGIGITVTVFMCGGGLIFVGIPMVAFASMASRNAATGGYIGG